MRRARPAATVERLGAPVGRWRTRAVTVRYVATVVLVTGIDGVAVRISPDFPRADRRDVGKPDESQK